MSSTYVISQPTEIFQVRSQDMADFANSDGSSLDRRGYLVGTPIKHSLSPLLHHSLYSSIGQNWGQVLYDTPDLASFVKMMKEDPKCFGSGVTMPFKLDIIPYLDELTPEGKAIGAINTIFFKTDTDGKRIYCGTNTDCIGVRDAFLWNVSDPSIYKSKPGLVVGGGGTCRAAVYSLQNFLSCSPIYIVNRDKSEVDAVIQECQARNFGHNIIHVATVEQAKSLQAPGAIVSAVPDFPPVTENEKIARDILRIFLSSEEKGALLEMCYHPSPDTQTSQLAISLGWPVIMGTEAMVGQGLEQARLWTGIQISESLRGSARAAVQQAISKRLNM